MEVHKPKPWHGWREFLKEYLIIVVGVLTALAAEQAVQALHHREQLARTREVLRAEMGRMLGEALLSDRGERCKLVQVSEYDAWARGGTKPGYHPSTFTTLRGSVWEEARAGGVVAFMDIDERLAFGRFYGNAANISSLVETQRELGRRLEGFRHLDTLDRPDGQALLREVGAYRGLMRAMISNTPQLVALARQEGVTPTPPPAAQRKVVDDLCRAADRAPKTASDEDAS